MTGQDEVYVGTQSHQMKEILTQHPSSEGDKKIPKVHRAIDSKVTFLEGGTRNPPGGPWLPPYSSQLSIGPAQSD